MKLLPLICLVTLPGLLLHADEAASVPEGHMNFSLAGGSVASPKLTTFCLPLRSREAAFFTGRTAGVISGVATASLSDSTGGWAAGALSQPAAPYFLRITSGAAAGYVFQISTSSANTATTVTLLNQGLNLTTLGITTGTDTYQIFPGDTLLSLFGTGGNGNNGTVLGSNSMAGADVVRLNVGSSWIDYYYDTATGFWRQSGLPVNRNNTVIHPNTGISYFRKAATGITLTILGTAPDGPARTVVSNGGATYEANNFPVDRTLGSLGLQTIPGFVSANPPTVPVTSADTVSIWNGTGWKSYHYNAALSQWREGSLPVNRSTTVIPAGVPVWIQKKTISAGSATHAESAPYSF